MEAKFIFFTLTSCCMAVFVTASWNLEAKNDTVLIGETATLQCTFEKPANHSDKLYHNWGIVGSPDSPLFHESDNQGGDTRMLANFNDNSMSLSVSAVTLDDEKFYRCRLTGFLPQPIAKVYLNVHKNPTSVDVTNFEYVTPEDGSQATVAECRSTGSKPAPTMWFTDEYGQLINVDDAAIHTTDPDTKLVNSVLSLKRTFTKQDDKRSYKCHVKHVDGHVESRDTSSFRVKYAPSAKFLNADEDERMFLQEETTLAVTCKADGNPKPTITWKFIPAEDTAITMPENQPLPNNFEVSEDGRTLKTESLLLTNSTSTNNGTFECKASNGIGSDVRLSFSVGVFAAPVTTVPTTTEATAVMQPNTAGLSAAVIAGIVVVVVFVLIVLVVLTARYFMSHKGTYRTNEMKNRDLEEDGNDDEHPMVGDEDELGGKKRTEYFM